MLPLSDGLRMLEWCAYVNDLHAISDGLHCVISLSIAICECECDFTSIHLNVGIAPAKPDVIGGIYAFLASDAVVVKDLI